MPNYNCPQCIAEMPGSENLTTGDIVVSDCNHQAPDADVLNHMFIEQFNNKESECRKMVIAFLEEGLKSGIHDCEGITLAEGSGVRKQGDEICVLIILNDEQGDGISWEGQWNEPWLLTTDKPITEMIGNELRAAVKAAQALREK